MRKLTTNISLLLGIIILGVGGYYVYTQDDLSGSVATSEQSLQSMLSKTQIFIERRQVLETVSLETSFLRSSDFTSLRNFSTPIRQQSVGRADPFSETAVFNNRF